MELEVTLEMLLGSQVGQTAELGGQWSVTPCPVRLALAKPWASKWTCPAPPELLRPGTHSTYPAPHKSPEPRELPGRGEGGEHRALCSRHGGAVWLAGRARWTPLATRLGYGQVGQTGTGGACMALCLLQGLPARP